MLPLIAEYLGKEASNKEGWLTGLADAILQNSQDNHIQLAIAFPVKEALEQSKLLIPVKDKQEVLTCYSFVEDVDNAQKYDVALERSLQEVITDWEPDVVHCFGTEYPHTLAVTRVCPKEKVLVGIQGILKYYAEGYLADLPEYVSKRVTFRDWLKKDSILQQMEKYTLRGVHEQEILKNAGHATGRTAWDKSYALACNPQIEYHFMNETLRSNFYDGQWKYEDCEKYSIFLSQGDYPLKGLHYALKALPEILKKYPEAKLYVAGNPIIREKNFMGKVKISSYGKYIMELLEKLKIEEKVVFLGRMSASEMKERFLKSHIFLCPSVLENSPNSLGEAMLLGVPCVSACVGGISSIFEVGIDGIAYPGYGAAEYAEEMDKESAQAEKLAEAVCEMWQDEEKLEYYTKNAAAHAKKNHNGQANYQRLLEIYKEIVGK